MCSRGCTVTIHSYPFYLYYTLLFFLFILSSGNSWKSTWGIFQLYSECATTGKIRKNIGGTLGFVGINNSITEEHSTVYGGKGSIIEAHLDQ
jgi:hypothetical protein